ncbi:MAG: hypothetical protein CL920_25035 [Deltaproteobacteria bacterium]|nr:hypothetical protein [Deltaproteobacteria bacterium]MBU51970.1 hypothetical protein [Deltaproteobacteria bacterium]|tara:strand:+ start:2707 stop:4161 length:1455 start_codon:yes stop_codon:yes gene_type:complete
MHITSHVSTNPQPTTHSTDIPSNFKSAIQGGTVLKRGAKGALVKELQNLLNEAGANPKLVADGDFGRGTENALKIFQRQHNLTTDGKFGRGTLAKLEIALQTAATDHADHSHDDHDHSVTTGVSTRTTGSTSIGGRLMSAVDGGQVLKRGAKGTTVKELQQLLNRAGASPALTADGDFGRGTENAVKAFQRKHGLGADGKFGRGTLAKLKEVLQLGVGTSPNGGTTVDNNNGGTTVDNNNGDTTVDNNNGGTNTTNDGVGQAIENQLGVFGGSLRRGGKGNAVRELQTLLNRAGANPKLTADGDFGRGTENAVKAFQRKHGLGADGKFGKGTWAALKKELGVDFKASDPLSDAGLSGTASTHYAYKKGKRLGKIQVVRIDGKPVEINTARSFLKMREAAQKDGVNIKINSGFRSYEEQKRLYDLYKAGRGNLAARPGYSNHQHGPAVDLNTRDPKVLRWLNKNGKKFGFVRTVPSEPWHWEYRP